MNLFMSQGKTLCVCFIWRIDGTRMGRGTTRWRRRVNLLKISENSCECTFYVLQTWHTPWCLQRMQTCHLYLKFTALDPGLVINVISPAPSFQKRSYGDDLWGTCSKALWEAKLTKYGTKRSWHVKELALCWNLTNWLAKPWNHYVLFNCSYY